MHGTRSPMDDKHNSSTHRLTQRCRLPRRIAAMVYDGLLLVALWMVAAALVVVPTGREIEPGSTLFQAYLLIVAWGYLAICWRRGGQTLGMKAWRIRLKTDKEKEPVTWIATAVRFVVSIASLLCFGLGFIWSLFHPHRATWHDLASGTWLQFEPGRGSEPSQHDNAEQSDEYSRKSR